MNAVTGETDVKIYTPDHAAAPDAFKDAATGAELSKLPTRSMRGKGRKAALEQRVGVVVNEGVMLDVGVMLPVGVLGPDAMALDEPVIDPVGLDDCVSAAGRVYGTIALLPSDDAPVVSNA